MNPIKYRAKPVIVEAMQVQSNNFAELAEWLPNDGNALVLASPGRVSVRIETLAGTLSAVPGDYIIKGAQGELYTCKSDLFAKMYEAAE